MTMADHVEQPPGPEPRNDPGRRRPRREPLRGQELIDTATDCVLQRYGPRALARKCRIPFREAEKIHAQLSETIYARAESRYTPAGLKRIKHGLVTTLEMAVEDCAEEVRRSRKVGGLNTRAHTRLIAAVKQLSTMLGLNAPVQLEDVTTDRGLIAREQTKALLSHPRGVELLLETEQLMREILGDVGPDEHATN